MVGTNREESPQAHKADWRVASAPEMIVLLSPSYASGLSRGVPGRTLRGLIFFRILWISPLSTYFLTAQSAVSFGVMLCFVKLEEGSGTD